MINPSYALRQVYELEAATVSARSHITSLRPIRPQNAADPWEAEALRSFGRGQAETSSIEPLGGQPHMRLMRPLVTEKSCLRCHEEQGYRIGDIRGGISVSVPMAPLQAIARNTWSRCAWATACCGCWGWLGSAWGRGTSRGRSRLAAMQRSCCARTCSACKRLPSETPG